MTFNQFNKELEQRIPDPQLRYFFATMFERHIAMSKQLDELAGLVLNLVRQNEAFANFNVDMQRRVKKVERRGRPDGVEVESVLSKPEK